MPPPADQTSQPHRHQHRVSRGHELTPRVEDANPGADAEWEVVERKTSSTPSQPYTPINPTPWHLASIDTTSALRSAARASSSYASAISSSGFGKAGKSIGAAIADSARETGRSLVGAGLLPESSREIFSSSAVHGSKARSRARGNCASRGRASERGRFTDQNGPFTIATHERNPRARDAFEIYTPASARLDTPPTSRSRTSSLRSDTESHRARRSSTLRRRQDWTASLRLEVESEAASDRARTITNTNEDDLPGFTDYTSRILGRSITDEEFARTVPSSPQDRTLGQTRTRSPRLAQETRETEYEHESNKKKQFESHLATETARVEDMKMGKSEEEEDEKSDTSIPLSDWSNYSQKIHVPRHHFLLQNKAAFNDQLEVKPDLGPECVTERGVRLDKKSTAKGGNRKGIQAEGSFTRYATDSRSRIMSKPENKDKTTDSKDSDTRILKSPFSSQAEEDAYYAQHEKTLRGMERFTSAYDDLPEKSKKAEEKGKKKLTQAEKEDLDETLLTEMEGLTTSDDAPRTVPPVPNNFQDEAEKQEKEEADQARSRQKTKKEKRRAKREKKERGLKRVMQFDD